MSTVLWIVGTVVFILSLLAIFAVSYLRTVKMPHSKKMAAAQRQMDKKTGATEEVPLPASAGRVEEKKSSKWSKLKPGLTTGKIFLFALGGAVIYWGLYAPWIGNPRMSDVGSWSWHHWLPLLILWGIVATFISLIEKAQTKKTLQSVLVGVMFLLFIGLPVIGWFGDSPHRSSPYPKTVLPQDAVNIPWAWHLNPSKWPQVKVPAHGDSAHVPGIYGGHVVWGGSGFTVRCLYTNGHIGTVGDPNNPCTDGDIVESWAHNESDTSLLASYAFARVNEK